MHVGPLEEAKRNLAWEALVGSQGSLGARLRSTNPPARGSAHPDGAHSRQPLYPSPCSRGQEWHGVAPIAVDVL